VPVSIGSTASTIIHGIIGNLLSIAINLTLGALLPAQHLDLTYLTVGRKDEVRTRCGVRPLAAAFPEQACGLF
jgi:hypothetical protein